MRTKILATSTFTVGVAAWLVFSCTKGGGGGSGGGEAPGAETTGGEATAGSDTGTTTGPTKSGEIILDDDGGGGGNGPLIDVGAGISSQVSVLAARDQAAIATAGTVQISTGMNLVEEEPTDYDRDRTDVTVADDSMAVLTLANKLLCVMNQTAYKEMVNDGKYVATIDVDSCFQRGKLDPASTLSKPRTQARVVVESTLEEGSPLAVASWFDVELNNQVYSFAVHLGVTQGATRRNPFGAFRLRYRAQLKGDSNARAVGVLETSEIDGDVVLRALDGSLGGFGSNPGMAWTVARLVYDEQGKNTHGVARGRRSGMIDFSGAVSAGSVPEDLSVLYDASHYLVDDRGAKECRDRANPVTKVYRTGVYDKATKERVYSSQSFFLISKPDGAGGTRYGSVTGFNPPIHGFYPEPVVGDRFTIYHQDAQGNTRTSQGRVAKSLGIFYKRTHYPLPTSVAKAGSYIAQEDFLTADNDMANYDPHLTITRWSESKQYYEVIQRAPTMNFDFVPVNPPDRYKLDGTDILFQVGIDQRDIPTMRVTVNTGAPDQLPQVVKLNLQPYVSGTLATDTYFRCMYGCLRPNLTEAMLTNGDDRYFPHPTDNNSTVRYVFDVATQTLMYVNGNSRQPVVIANLDMPDPEPTHYWPSMEVVLESEFNTLKQTYGVGDIVSHAIETYGWATLGNAAYNAEANRFKYLRDDDTGESLKLTGNPRLGHSIQQADLLGPVSSPYSYGTYVVFGVDELGFLQGIPATGDNMSGYTPSFGFKPGTEVKGLDGHAYLVKPLDVVETMPQLAVGACSGLQGDAAELPDDLPGSGLAEGFGAAPAISAAPRVVAGKVVR